MPGGRRATGWFPYLVRVLVLAVAYLAAQQLGLHFATIGGNVAPVYPAAGIGLAALILWGVRFAPGLVLVSIVGDLWAGGSLAASIGMAIGSAAGAVAGVLVLRRVGFERSLRRVQDVSSFVFAGALLPSVVAALVGVTVLSTDGVIPASAYWKSVWIWVAGDGTGILLVAAFLLVWWAPGLRGTVRNRGKEAAVLFPAVLGVAVVVFRYLPSTAFGLSYLVFPGMVVASVRFRPRGATLTALMVSAVAVVATVEGFGPFTSGSVADNLAELDTFLAVMAVTGLVLAAITTQREQADEALRREQDLVSRIAETSPVGIVAMSAQGEFTFANAAAERVLGMSRDEVRARTYTTPDWRITDRDGGPVPEEELAFSRVRASGQPVHDVRHTVERSDGQRILLSINAAPIFTTTGELDGMIASLEDITERAQVEDEVRHLATFPQLNPIPVAEFSLQEEVLFVNPAMRLAMERWGIDDPRRFIPPDWRQGLSSPDHIRPGKDTEEVQINGRVFEERIRLIHGSKSLRAYAVDITERKQAEEDLRETNEYLDNLFNYANAPMIVWDTRFRITRFNPAFEKLTGRQAGDVIGGTLDVLFPPEDTDRMMGLIRKTQSGERWETVEIGIQNGDGTVRTVIWNSAPILANDGKTQVATIAQGQDITERKQAEEEVRESEARYRSLFENMLEGFSYCRMIFEDDQPQDFIYLDVNSRFEELTGLKDVVGKRVTDVIPGIRESHPELFEIYGRVALTGEPERFETYLDNVGWLSISVYSSRREHFIAVFDNITERKRAEGVLRHSEAEVRDLLRHLLRAQEEESARVSRLLHDSLGQTLTSVSLFVKDLEEELGDEHSERLARVREVVESAVIETRRFVGSLRSAVLDPGGLGPALRRLVEEARAGGLAVDLRDELGDARLPARVETATYRIVQEALTNALHHAEASSVSVVVGREGGRLAALVEDDGCGFDPDAVLAGLPVEHFGLIGMRERAEMLGGSVTVESSPGHGTRVRAEIPVT